MRRSVRSWPTRPASRPEKAALVDETALLFVAEAEAASARDALLEVKAALVVENGGLAHESDGLLTEKAVLVADFR